MKKLILAGVAILTVGVGAAHADVTDPSDTSSPLVFIGQRGVFTARVFGCPTWDGYGEIIGDIVHHDSVGFDQDFAKLGCIDIRPGDKGLQIDNGWFSAKLRLDKDPDNTYWTETERSDGSIFLRLGSKEELAWEASQAEARAKRQADDKAAAAKAQAVMADEDKQLQDNAQAGLPANLAVIDKLSAGVRHWYVLESVGLDAPKACRAASVTPHQQVTQWIGSARAHHSDITVPDINVTPVDTDKGDEWAGDVEITDNDGSLTNLLVRDYFVKLGDCQHARKDALHSLELMRAAKAAAK